MDVVKDKENKDRGIKRFNPRNAFILCVAIVFGTILYGEVVIYCMQARHSQDLQCQVGDESCTKILFIADPQIQGERAVAPPLSYLFNWDSDRYLRQTFNRVFNHFQPDALVFLGDLMNEGSIATPEQYHSYVKRLTTIFVGTQQIWVPGDNDIGGENETIRWDKVELFQKVFNQSLVVAVKGVTFFKVNAITHEVPTMPHNVTDKTFKIVISHYPLLTKHDLNEKVTSNLRPDIYFCAHELVSKYTTLMRTNEWKTTSPLHGNQVLNIDIAPDAELYEIHVPTCSYSTGTRKIGYGAAVVENNNTRVRYTVFWSPERFPILLSYLTSLLFLALFGLVWVSIVCWQRYHSRRNGTPLRIDN